MFPTDTIVVHRNHATGGWYYADVCSGFAKLYTSPLRDKESLRGWISDLKQAVDNARCLWCGEPIQYVQSITDDPDLEVLGFCSEEDYTLALRESEAMARSEP